jgi:hypothetical protein
MLGMLVGILGMLVLVGQRSFSNADITDGGTNGKWLVGVGGVMRAFDAGIVISRNREGSDGGIENTDGIDGMPMDDDMHVNGKGEVTRRTIPLHKMLLRLIVIIMTI